jgi:hypothetical protein
MMMKLLCSLLLLSFVALSFHSVGATPITPPVVEVPSVTGTGGLKSDNFGGSEFIRIDDYASKGDGGGGYFVLDNASGSANACHNGQDGGVTLQDGKSPGPNCFVRRFTGAVHVKWYGVTNLVQDASSQINAAIAATVTYGNGCVDLDGLQVHIGSSAAGHQFGVIEVPSNVVIGCDDASITGASVDFSTLPNTLALYESAQSFTHEAAATLGSGGLPLNGTQCINVSSASGFNASGYIWISGNEIVQYSTTDGVCLTGKIDVIARAQLGTKHNLHASGEAITSAPLNWSIVLDGNDGIQNVSILPQWLTSLGSTSGYTLRQWLDSVTGAFYGQALRCQDNGCNIENVNVLGFDTGIEAVNAPRLYIHHTVVDANTCYQFHNIGNQTQGGDMRCFPMVNSGSANNDLAWSIAGVSSDAGICKLSVSGGSTNDNNWFIGGDTVWISNLV